MESKASVRIISELADLKFIKITETIFKVEKDRRRDYSGSIYVSDEDVLDSLNSRNVVIFNDPLGLSIHHNFQV